ncbi:MAG: DUF3466 family protein [Phycisphaerales bacterium]|nr:MAG: DUF3466 family protein [Phycisphaerales bacterium]
MKPKTAKTLTVAAIIAAVLAAAIIRRRPPAPEYEITDLGSLKKHGCAHAINNEGHVVGCTYRVAPDARAAAFIWSPEKGRRSIPALEGKESRAYDINDKGQVVGYFSELDSQAPDRAFIWDEETGITELGTPGGDSQAHALNNKGQVVGASKTPDGQWRPFIWDKTNGMRDLGTFGGKSSLALDINEKGQVVGYSDMPDGKPHAFIWQQDTGMVDIGAPGGRAARARSINNSGQVGGQRAKKGDPGGFIWQVNAGMIDLDIKGQIRRGVRINDSGQAVAYYFTPKFLTFKERHSVFFWDVTHGAAKLDIGLENISSIGALDINNRGQILVCFEKSGQNQVVILTPKDKSRPKGQ